MCGIFTFAIPPELLAEIFGVTVFQDLPLHDTIAPGQHAPIIRDAATDGRYMSTARWGLVPHWTKDLSIGNRMINARCETVHENPSFRIAIRARRCIVPASGFFEWATTSTGKLPHYITMRERSPLAFAGIWDSWKTPEGEVLETCAILTTTANSLMAVLHDRMPVILHPTEFDLWLDRSMNNPEKLQRLYQPYPSELMQEWEVSTPVNSPPHAPPESSIPVDVTA
jgi:putative SOS response-associated peptidase YedK